MSEHIGNVGERITLTLTPKAFRYMGTDWGTSTLVTYETEDGDIVKWFASKELEIELDRPAVYEMTIKAHKEFDGDLETHVSRVTLYMSPEDKKERAKKRKAAKLEYQARKERTDEAWDTLSGESDEIVKAELYQAYLKLRDEANDAYRAWKSL